jgi:GTP cyclohydrolase IA
MAKLYQDIIKEMQKNGHRFWAGDNVSDYITDIDRQQLIEDAATSFESVLDSLLIDRHNDPNSKGTAKRLAKMYYNEIMGGRYDSRPDVTAFPNDNDADRYTGMIVTRAEIKSMCSHHHQPVKGVAYIGLIPGTKVIGLSKYARIAQWCARRGTLQEELCRQIAEEIQAATGAEDVGIYIQATHGCMENRGVEAHSSLTQTAVLRGQFYNDSIKKEFYDNIREQQRHAC